MALSRGLISYCALVGAMLFWSTSFLALKLALTEYGPMQVMAGRMGCASLAVFVLWCLFRKRIAFHYQSGDWKAFAVLCLSEPCLYFIFEVNALRYTSASEAGMIVSVLPLLVAVAARIVLKEHLAGRVWCGFCIAILGVAGLSLAGAATESAPNPLLGNALEALAMLCATAYTISAKQLFLRYSSMIITAVQALAGAVFFIPLSLLFPAGGDRVSLEIAAQLPETAPTLAIIYLGCVVTFGGYGLYNYGVSRIPAGQAAAFTNLIPVLTLLMAFVFFGERLLPWQWGATLLILAGIFMSQGSGNDTEKSGKVCNGA